MTQVHQNSCIIYIVNTWQKELHSLNPINQSLIKLKRLEKPTIFLTAAQDLGLRSHLLHQRQTP